MTREGMKQSLESTRVTGLLTYGVIAKPHKVMNFNGGT